MADSLDNNHRDISYALDVEQLDLNSYRSRNLTLPYQARGVFGGQVISQALLAATKCVKPEFALHVRVHSHTTIFPRDPSSYVYPSPRGRTQSLHVRHFLALHQASREKGGEKIMTLLLRPISPSACPPPCRCITTSTKCVTDDLTRRVPSVPSRAGASSSSCSVPSRYRSLGSHLIIGPCHELLVRTNARAKSRISNAWRHSQTSQNSTGLNSSCGSKCVYLSRRFEATRRLAVGTIDGRVGSSLRQECWQLCQRT